MRRVARIAQHHGAFRWVRRLCTVSADAPSLGQLTVPTSVKRRIAALQTLGNRYVQMELEYQERQRALEAEMRAKMLEILDRRRTIVSGTSEPEEAELVDSELDVPPAAAIDDEVRGVPGFWGRAMVMCEALRLEVDQSGCRQSIISQVDFKVQQHLEDLEIVPWQSPPERDVTAPHAWMAEGAGAETEMGFALLFRFGDNPYMAEGGGDCSLYCHSTGEVVRAMAPSWRNGMDPRFMLRTKKIKRKDKPVERVTSLKEANSFFRIFDQATDEEIVEARAIGESLHSEDASKLVYSTALLQDQLVIPLAEEFIPHASIYYVRSLFSPPEAGSDAAGDGLDDQETGALSLEGNLIREYFKSEARK